jgi:hypothetical protein
MGANSTAVRRWVGVGRAELPSPEAAGAAAARDAVAGRADAKLLIVFSAHTYDQVALLRGIRTEAADVPLIGCTTAGEFTAAGPGDGGVVVTALGGEGFTVRTAVAVVEDDDLREAATRAAGVIAELPDEEGLQPLLLLLSDGLVGDQEQIVRGAYAVAGAAVPLIGGCAGDGQRMVATAQLHGDPLHGDPAVGDQVLERAIVVAAISSDGPVGIGVRHGWRRVGEPVRVTASEGTTVRTLDGRPALDVYFDHLDVAEEVRHDPAAFTAFAATHPLGVPRRSREEVRFVAGAGFEDRTLSCIANVSQGGLAWFMEGDVDSVLAATDGACEDALGELEGQPPIGLIAFDCVARRGVLGDVERQEVGRVVHHAAGAPLAGFYTYGEIARTRGVDGFHNQTMVVLALA